MESIHAYLSMNAALENEGRGMCSFTLKHGREWKAAPFKERSPIRRGVPKQCFANCQGILLKLFKKGQHEAYTYVEGYASSGNLDFTFPVLHAWLTDQDGNVIDPTWGNPEKSIYFGVPFKTDYVFDLIEKSKQYHSIIDHFPSKWELLRDISKAEEAILNWDQDVILSEGYVGLR